MFDIGFSELVVIGLVALIVIGPERMPVVARTLGALLGRAQRYVNEVKYEIRREMQVEDLKKFQSQITEQIQEVENTIHGELRSVEDAARQSVDLGTETATVADLERQLVEPPPAAAVTDKPAGTA